MWWRGSYPATRKTCSGPQVQSREGQGPRVELTAGPKRGNLSAMPDEKAILAALRRFADTVTAKMTTLTVGEPEDQLRGPFDEAE